MINADPFTNSLEIESTRTDGSRRRRNQVDLEEMEMNSLDNEHSTLLLNTTSPSYRPRQHHNNDWVSLSALVDERRSDGRLMTNLDEDDEEPSTPFDRRNVADSMTHGLKQQLYLLLEDPASSRAAFWTNVVVSALIVFSVIMTTVETIPAFRSAESNRVW
jgi:hypothetical protein